MASPLASSLLLTRRLMWEGGRKRKAMIIKAAVEFWRFGRRRFGNWAFWKIWWCVGRAGRRAYHGNNE
jgi:hypothetical protein